MTEASIDRLLNEIYSGHERLTNDEIQRRAVLAEAPTDLMTTIDALPEGEYSQDEAEEAIAQMEGAVPMAAAQSDEGIPAAELDDDDLLRELAHLHRTREETLKHGSEQALARHSERTLELEAEYLRRFPEREVDPRRTRAGARTIER